MANSLFSASTSAPGERVEQRGLASVGVAHKRRQRQPLTRPSRPRVEALTAQFLKILADARNALTDAASFQFQLGFAAALVAENAAGKSVERTMPSGKTRQRILQLRHLHLQLACACHGVTGKNIENELRSVHDPALRQLRKAVELRRAEFPVENDERRLPLKREHFQFRQLGAAENVTRMYGRHALNHGAGHLHAGGAGQLGQFGQMPFLHGPRLQRHRNQHGPFPGLFLAGAHGVVDDAAELLFQTFRLKREVGVHAIPGLHVAHRVAGILLTGRGRHEVRALEHAGLPPLVHGEHAHGVQTQEKKIHEVFVREALGNKMRMQKAQAAQTTRARAHMGKRGNENGRSVPHNDHVHPALPVQREAYLTGKQARERRQFSRLFGAVAPLRRIAALPQPVESLQLAGLETGGVAFNPGGYFTPPAIQVAIMSS